MNAPSTELRQQLDSLQAELSTRSSTLHFAHTGVSLVAAVIVGGAAGKLAWDSPKYWWIGAVVGAIAFALVVYSVVRYRMGTRALRAELERFGTLQALRRTLHLDDPSALLPE